MKNTQNPPIKASTKILPKFQQQITNLPKKYDITPYTIHNTPEVNPYA
jgi:hypothetical protein